MLDRRNFLIAAGAIGLARLQSTSPVRADAADGFVELRAASTQVAILGESSPVDLWTYNGQSPGPEIRVKRGGRVRVRLINDLDQPTTIHWHGVRLSNAMDGVPDLTQDPVPPGKTFEYDFVAPDAGTYFYHTHFRAWEQMARGLYGPLIVEEENPPVLQAFDKTLVIDDWRIDRQGQIDTPSLGQMMDWSHAGRLGNRLTANGRTMPDIRLSAGDTYRVRVINACNSRILEFDLDAINARVAALDGQPLPEPVCLPYKPFLLGPAQRADLLVSAEEAGSIPFQEISDQPFTFARFVFERNSSAHPKSIGGFEDNELPEPVLSQALQFDLVMEGGAMGGMRGAQLNGTYLGMSELVKHGLVWAFNGRAGLPDIPWFRVRKGQSVVLRVENRTGWPHAMHIHGHHLRILSRNGTADPLRQWRDTFLIGANGVTKIAFVADNPGKWLFHCHMLEHQVAGMTTWFEVAEG